MSPRLGNYSRTLGLLSLALLFVNTPGAAQKPKPTILVVSGTGSAAAPADSASILVWWRLREMSLPALARRDSAIVAFLDSLPPSFPPGTVSIRSPSTLATWFSAFPRFTDTVLTESRSATISLRGAVSQSHS